MTTTKNKTAAQVRMAAVAAFRRANPDAAGAAFEWAHGPVLAPWADGSKGWNGVLAVEAPGYRARRMIVSANADLTGLTVR